MSIPVQGRLSRWGIPLAVLALLGAAISGESFWIDEVSTAWLTLPPTLAGVWQSLGETGSEAQMPVFALYFWFWAKCFGISEVALRCANLPWILAAVWAMRVMLVRSGSSPLSLLWMMLPIFPFYMNEARPYIMTVGSAFVALAAVDAMFSDEEPCSGGKAFWAWLFPLSLLVCVGSSLLNLCLLPALAAYLLVPGPGRTAEDDEGLKGHIRKLLAAAKRHAVSLGLATGITVLLALYYAWTLSRGFGGQKEPFTVTNLMFAVYEWLGFGGLGAPRNELREIGPMMAMKQYWLTIIIGAVAWGVAGVAVALQARRLAADRLLLRSMAGLFCGGLMLVVAAVAAPASVWGRHFISLAPFVLLALSRGLGFRDPSERAVLLRVAALAVLASSLISGYRQRFVAAYEKDPYREAVQELRQRVAAAAQPPIVWIAYRKALVVYGGNGMPFRSAFLPGQDPAVRIYVGAGWAKKDVEAWTKSHPEFLLFIHRPDKLDPEGVWTEIAKGGLSELVWQKGNIRLYRVRSSAR